MTTRRIDFAIVGAQKASTTFVHHCLRLSPAISMPAGETPLFQGHHYAPAKIAALLKEAKPGTLFGIKRPLYLYDANIANRLHRHNPQMKIIVVLRERISRSLSAYYHLMRYGQVPVREPEEGLRLILEATDGVNAQQAHTVLNYSQYAFNLGIYQQLFGPGQVLVVTQRQLKGEDRTGVHTICDFLGIETPDISPMMNNAYQRSTYSLAAIELLAQAARLESWCNEQGVVLQARRNLPEVDKVSAQALRARANSLNADSAPPLLSPALRASLSEYFREDCRAYEAMGLPALEAG